MKTSKTLLTITALAAILILSAFLLAAKPDAPADKPKDDAGDMRKGPQQQRFMGQGQFDEMDLVGRPFPMINKLDNLTEEQKTKINAVKDQFEKDRDTSMESMKKLGKELRELVKSDPDTPDTIKSKLKEFTAAKSQMTEKRIDSIYAVKKILTKEQWAQIKGMAEGFKMGHQMGNQEGKPEGRMMGKKMKGEPGPGAEMPDKDENEPPK